MTKGDRWKVRQGWRSPGWAKKPSSGEPDAGEPDAIKVARPVREGAVGNLRKPVATVVRRRESQQGAGRLLHAQDLISTENSLLQPPACGAGPPLWRRPAAGRVNLDFC